MPRSGFCVFKPKMSTYIYQCPKSKWHFTQFIKSFLFSVLVCAFICFYSMTERELNFVTCVEEELLNIQLTLMNNYVPRHSRDRVDSESVSRVGVWLAVREPSYSGTNKQTDKHTDIRLTLYYCRSDRPDSLIYDTVMRRLQLPLDFHSNAVRLPFDDLHCDRIGHVGSRM